MLYVNIINASVVGPCPFAPLERVTSRVMLIYPDLNVYSLQTQMLLNFSVNLAEMVGELFLPHDMPEPPKESFFRGLFGGGTRSLDREELCKLCTSVCNVKCRHSVAEQGGIPQL